MAQICADISTGSCVVGNVATRKRFDCTAIGGAVNVAAQGFRFREIGPILVKGRVEPVAVNEVLGLA